MMKTGDRTMSAAANTRRISERDLDAPIAVPGDWRGQSEDRWWFVGLAALPFALLMLVSTIAISTLSRLVST